MDNFEDLQLSNPVHKVRAKNQRVQYQAMIDAHLDGILSIQSWKSLEKKISEDKELFEYYNNRKAQLSKVSSMIPEAALSMEQIKSMSNRITDEIKMRENNSSTIKLIGHKLLDVFRS